MMKRVGMAMSVACVGLLAACAPQHDGQQHSLNAESRLRVAEAAEASGDKQIALSMYAAAANDSPTDTAVQVRSAEGLARNGGVEDAAALLARRLKATPHDTDLQGILGEVQVMAGEPAKGASTLSDVLAAKPDDLKALVNKAVALDMMRKHDEAQVLYRKALAQAPGDMTISNDLALSLMLSGRQEEARQTLSPFRDVANLPDRVATNLGILDAASGHSAEARQILGSRMGAGDLDSMTQAISMQTAGFQPDGGSRNVARESVSSEPYVPDPIPALAAHRAMPVAARVPVPDQIVSHAPAQPYAAAPSGRAPVVPVGVDPAIADALPTPRHVVLDEAAVPVAVPGNADDPVVSHHP